MKRILSAILTFVLLAALTLPVLADGVSSVTITSFPLPAAGAKPSSSMTLDAGSLASVEWYSADGSETLMAEGETFRAGHAYVAILYINPPSGMEWRALEIGEVTYTDISDVTVRVYDTAGKSLDVSGNYLWKGQLTVRVAVSCPGTPEPEEKIEDDTEVPLIAPTPEKVRPDFSDVAEGAWFRDSVYDAADLGLINGKGKGDDGRDRFDPDGLMTFAEASKLAACMHELYTTGKVTLQNGDPWYKSYVDYCASNGILSSSAENGGITAKDVMSRANETVTRGEFAWIFAHALPADALPAKNTIPDGAIPDVTKTSDFWYASVYMLYRAGILKGNDDAGTFHPSDNIRRSEVAAITVRMFKADKRVDAPANLKG